MTSATPSDLQESVLAHLNNSWGVARFDLEPNGELHIVLDDGDECWIDRDGETVRQTWED